MKSLYKALIEAGYLEEEMFHWQSDLYVFVTPLTTQIVEDWCKENGFDRTLHCPIFKDNVTGRAMYDCAFCYEPFFSERNKGVSKGKDVAALMALFKLARVATGHDKADNYIDCCGYAACAGELQSGYDSNGAD